MASLDQACLWALGDSLAEAGGDADAGGGMLEQLALCLSNPTPGCADAVKSQADRQAAAAEANPVAVALRDLCLADPTPECLITFAMAYANTASIGWPFRATIQQILPFITDGKMVLATEERRTVSSLVLSAGNLDYVRWLLDARDTATAKEFLPNAAFNAKDLATAGKLLAITLARAGDLNGAFEIASPLYVLDEDWRDRFEMVAEIVAAYGRLSAPDAAAMVEGLGGQTDNTAGFAGLALYHAEIGDLEAARAALDKAIAGIAGSFYPPSRADGYTYMAEELARRGAFELARTALDELVPQGGLTLEFPARTVAAELAGAGRPDEGLALMAELSPDHGDLAYYLMALHLGRSDGSAARAFVEGLPAGEFQIAGAQGYAQAMFEAGDPAEGTSALAEFGSAFNDSPSFQTSIPGFAAALAKQGKLSEALALAVSDRNTVTAFAFAAIALALKGGDWPTVVELGNWD